MEALLAAARQMSETVTNGTGTVLPTAQPPGLFERARRARAEARRLRIEATALRFRAGTTWASPDEPAKPSPSRPAARERIAARPGSP